MLIVHGELFPFADDVRRQANRPAARSKRGSMNTNPFHPIPSVRKKQDADYVFYELTRSICPDCRRVIDAHVILRDNKVYMRKRCPEHGQFEALVYGDARAYTSA